VTSERSANDGNPSLNSEKAYIVAIEAPYRRILELTKGNTELKDNIRKTNGATKEVLLENHELAKENAALKDDVRNANFRNDGLTKENEALKGDLRKDDSESNARLDTLNYNCHSLQVELDSLQIELEEGGRNVRSRNSELTVENAALRDDLRKAKADIEQLSHSSFNNCCVERTALGNDETEDFAEMVRSINSELSIENATIRDDLRKAKAHIEQLSQLIILTRPEIDDTMVDSSFTTYIERDALGNDETEDHTDRWKPYQSLVGRENFERRLGRSKAE
jgi:uncharacterized phage infection (PIP) family protein YhgE